MSGAPESEQSICIGCGLCCDGTVVTHLAIRDESDLGAPLRGLGVQVIAAADPPVFELPCPALDGGRCSIHSLHRPSACSQFECALSQAVIDGTASFNEARLVIDSALNLRHEVRIGRADARAFDEMVTQVFRTGRV